MKQKLIAFVTLLASIFCLFALPACDDTSAPSGNGNQTQTPETSEPETPDNPEAPEDQEQPQAPAYTRVNKDGTPNENGQYVLFGSYPQSQVTDGTLCDRLEGIAGELPSSENSQSWTSYKYYTQKSNQTDFMWYQDVTFEGTEYRGVYFTNFRPSYTNEGITSLDKTRQDDNGYQTENVYWFAYEPVLWRILKEEGGSATVLCEMLIDSQEFYHLPGRAYGDKVKNENHYAESNIRKWLNDTFYNTAFNSSQQACIEEVTVDNSRETTQLKNGQNEYACYDTQDKIWLLSYQDARNSDYGFTDYDSRMKKTTAYAQCQGAFTDTGTKEGNGNWWLRSPYYYGKIYAQIVSYDGAVHDNFHQVYCTSEGICPALQIKL